MPILSMSWLWGFSTPKHMWRPGMGREKIELEPLLAELNAVSGYAPFLS